MSGRPTLDTPEVREFCQRWQITELAVFGSMLREDFGPESDLDLLVEFAEDAEWSLWDHDRMERELADILGRDVDLITKRSIERSQNWVRRTSILGSAETVYGEG